MKLVFVYNADSGLLNTLSDIGHKLISPQTYQCSLCALTYGLLSERKQWRQFRERSTIEMEFLHKDEFAEKYAQKFAYPVVLNEKKDLRVLISQQELNQIKTLAELIEKVNHVTL